MPTCYPPRPRPDPAIDLPNLRRAQLILARKPPAHRGRLKTKRAPSPPFPLHPLPFLAPFPSRGHPANHAARKSNTSCTVSLQPVAVDHRRTGAAAHLVRRRPEQKVRRRSSRRCGTRRPAAGCQGCHCSWPVMLSRVTPGLSRIGHVWWQSAEYAKYARPATLPRFLPPAESQNCLPRRDRHRRRREELQLVPGHLGPVDDRRLARCDDAAGPRADPGTAWRRGRDSPMAASRHRRFRRPPKTLVRVDLDGSHRRRIAGWSRSTRR